MERNNGVTAIIYLAFVRNRTLQPYFRSANTDAIFHRLPTFTFTQILHGSKHLSQLAHRPLALCVLLHGHLQRGEKEPVENEGEGEMTDELCSCRFFGHPKISK